MNAVTRLAILAALLLSLAAAPAALAASAHPRPDDRAGARGAASSGPAPARPDDRAGVRGAFAPAPRTPLVVTVAGDSFDWGSAGIGAGAGAGLVLALLGGVLITRTRRAEAEPA